ncbi:hypothetical protein [Sulfurivirga sp.]|uniref:hypothetical protein n=1 Tax=Sulfurivirga sp. TaxID=2614236 RepID=UPI0025DFCEF0|nr:hypothetical protein [Sulfurivirga sp.]
MQYKITQEEAQKAKIPFHIYNFNILITHLFLAYTILEIGHGKMAPFLLIPAISTTVILYICSQVKKKLPESWYVAANWMVACRRGKLLIGSYIVAIAMMGLYLLVDTLFPGGMSMQDFSNPEGGKTNIMQVVTMYFSGLVVFVTVLVTFIQTGISVFEAGQGILNDKIEQYLPRPEDQNPPLGKSEDEKAPEDIANLDRPGATE